jgi:hypothetical protein
MLELLGRLRGRAGQRALTFVACAAVLAAAGDVRADEPRVALSLNWIRLPGAEDCIDAAELARTVEQQLGRSVFVSPTAATRVIEGWTEPARPGWRVVLRASDAEGNASGRRELTSDSETCSSLNRSIVLAISLLAQSARGISNGPPETIAQEPRAAAPADLAETPGPRTADRRPGTVKPLSAGQSDLGPTFHFGWGVLPGTALGFGTRAAIALSTAWIAELGSTVWLPQSPAGAPSISFSRADIAVGACPVLAESNEVRISTCAGIMGSALLPSGRVPVESIGPYFSGYGRVVGSFGIAPLLWLTAGAGFGIPFNRASFTPWSMPFMTSSGEVGLLLHFGP